MEDEEEVVSDIHVFIPFQRNNSDNVVYTRFHVRCHFDDDDGEDDDDEDDDDEDDDDEDGEDDVTHGVSFGNIPCDDEGDYVIKRRKKNMHQSSEVITIEHQLATGLKDVGLQVWRGALLMADFILNNEQMFSGCYVMELGAGVGLCSIVLGRVASRVFCTETGHEAILKNCKQNVETNSHLYRNATMKENGDYNRVVKVRQLDWTKDCLPEDEGGCEFGWSNEDRHELDKITVLIAADVIYDNQLTDAFFKKVVHYLHKNDSAVLYITIEKRLNFTLEFLEVSCPAYDHFINTLQKLESEQVLQSRKIPTSFKQFLEYERVKELELWEIKRY
ncbi:methyltransferase-like protein 22 [Actinia tenebrosa]|uniref:Methyltransferase-like protein 22 n=1 Tax=Actinia tenebrosa TaxID=6105 RepID=A0A6P8HY60_ACTTE|nr:methyltransferase-like protein 22 [Actinia tenebrosa]